MKDPDRLQALFDALAQPATPSELADEAQTVDVVARAISVSKGSTMQIPSNSRRLRVASFLAAGIIGFGGVAAAGPAVFDTVTGEDDSSGGDLVVTSTVPDVSLPETTVPTTEPEATTTTEPEATTTTEPEATTTTEPEATTTTDVTDDEPSELVDDPDTDFDETECADGKHGKTVSSVAQATPSGPGKGAIVSEAAQSSCGKKEKSDKDNEADGVETDDDSEDDDDSDEDDDSDDSEEDEKEKEKEKGKKEKGSARDDSPARDQSQGNGNGNGKGKGKGKNG